MPSPQTPYELGSITKTFTGLLLADAWSAASCALDDRLADHLPELGGTPAGDITLEQLATHTPACRAFRRRVIAGSPDRGRRQPESVRGLGRHE